MEESTLNALQIFNCCSMQSKKGGPRKKKKIEKNANDNKKKTLLAREEKRIYGILSFPLLPRHRKLTDGFCERSSTLLLISLFCLISSLRRKKKTDARVGKC